MIIMKSASVADRAPTDFISINLYSHAFWPKAVVGLVVNFTVTPFYNFDSNVTVFIKIVFKQTNDAFIEHY